MPTKKIFVFYILMILSILIPLELICSTYLINRYRDSKLINHPNENTGYSLSSVKLFDGILRKFYYEPYDEDRYTKISYDFRKIIYSNDWASYYEKAYIKDIKSIRNDLRLYEKKFRVYRHTKLDYVYKQEEKNINQYLPNFSRKSFNNEVENICWIFGGSTVFGDGVSDIQTLSSYLNLNQKNYRFINFGVRGTDSNYALNYLLYLLKRVKNNPKCVIFFDGLNDAVNITKMPLFKPWDRPSDPNLLFNITVHRRTSNVPKESISVPEMYKYYSNVPLDNKNLSDASYIARRKLLYERIDFDKKGPREWINEATINHYKNIVLAKNVLGDDIKFLWILQPNGELNKNNIILKKHHFSTNRYFINKIYYELMIKNYAEEFLDYSKKDVNCKYCYIDEAHYSPYFLKELSKSIIKDMKLE